MKLSDDDTLGLQSYEFNDVNGTPCTMTVENRYTNNRCISIGVGQHNRIWLSRSRIATLLPILKHFAETGALP